MPDTPTPGQIAYDVYRAAILRPAAPPFRLLPYVEAAAWEAAAEAVLADGRSHARALVQHWHAWHRDPHAPALPLLTAMHALEAWLAEQEDDTHA